jgi:hypothetical protein
MFFSTLFQLLLQRIHHFSPMKKTSFLILLFSVFVSSSASAQWAPISVPDSIFFIPNIDFASSTRGAIIGVSFDTTTFRFRNYILNTTTGGTTWRVTRLPDSLASTDDFLGSLSYPDTTVTYLLARWIQSGNRLQANPKEVDMAALYKRKPSEHALVRQSLLQRKREGELSSPVLYRSTNDGLTWTVLTNFPTEVRGAVALNFFDRQNAVVLGGVLKNDSALIVTLRTTNGGTSWSRSSGFESPFEEVYGIKFTDAQNGYIFCTDTAAIAMYRTTNGGQMWSRTTFPTLTGGVALSFSSNQLGYFIGEENSKTENRSFLFRTTNGGQNWVPLTTIGGDTLTQLLGLAALKNSQSVVMPAINFQQGFFAARSSNAGASWRRDALPPLNLIVSTAAEYFDENTVYLAGFPAVLLVNRGFASVRQVSDVTPKAFALQQNYPNPFNPSTEIRYQVSGTSEVRLEVFDMLGRKVSTLVNERQVAGEYQATFNAAGLASGIYFYRIDVRSSGGSQTGAFTDTKKMLLIK